MTAEQMTILAVEDEAMIAMELVDMLEALGHEVIGPAATLEDALALLETSSLDAAIVDVNLGGASAKPLVEALRASGVPIVLASGYDTSDLASFGLVEPLIRKPYSCKDLTNALASVRSGA